MYLFIALNALFEDVYIKLCSHFVEIFDSKGLSVQSQLGLLTLTLMVLDTIGRFSAIIYKGDNS